MEDPQVRASIIAVAGEWAKVVFESTKPRAGLSKAESISLLRRDFEKTYKELTKAVKLLEKEDS